MRDCDDTRRGHGEILSLEGVGVWLGGRQILDKVGFRLAPGEFTGLIGPNGAGKTTILRVIMGLQAPSQGRVLVEGRPLTRRHRSVGYIPQQLVIDPDAPVRARDLVALGLDGERVGLRVPSRERRRRTDEMLDAVDATRFANSRVGALSGGEQQRVLIAHALISRPRLLLADEPLANLDIHSGQEIVDLLARLAADQRIAVLLSAHDMNPLLPVMDRVVYVAGGRVATGTSEEVVRTEVLSQLYGHPVNVLRVDGRVLVVSGSHISAEADPLIREGESVDRQVPADRR
jgi:zinc/manganese transport system ATP-binding protein